MNRLDKFLELKNHAWFKKQYVKLRQDNIDFCIEWINKNDSLSKDDFELALNRIYLDKDLSSLSKAEYNRYRISQELIMICNS
jgi:hypothetical protein